MMFRFASMAATALSLFISTAVFAVDVLEVEGTGAIQAGDTVKARRDAVDNLMRGAMRASLDTALSEGLKNSYGSMIEDNLVARFATFVKDYRILNEVGEAGTYRVKARVNLDQEKLRTELRAHGLLPLELEKPLALFFVAEPSKTGVRAWWRDSSPQSISVAGAGMQDSLTQRLGGTPLLVANWRKVMQESSQQPLREVFEKLRAPNSNGAPEDFAKAAETIRAAYVVFGTLENETRGCDLQVMRVEDRKFVGRLSLTASEFSQAGLDSGTRRLDAVVWRVAGLMLRDWLDRWQVERRLVVSFRGVQDLRAYGEVLKALRAVTEINSLQEERFMRRTAMVRLGFSKKPEELVALLKRQPYFRDHATFTVRDEKSIEADLQ